MNENKTERNEEMQIDMQRLWAAIRHKKWLILMTSIVTAVAVFLVSIFLITPLYQSTAMFYVNNYAQMESTGSITSSDISASKNLVDSYIVILNTRATLTEIIDYAGVDRTCEELADMLDASSVNATEIFQVVVTSPDPQEAAVIASAIAQVLPQRISSILDGTSAHVVDEAVVPLEPSSPNYTINTLVGFLAGLILSLCAVIIQSLSDVTIHSQEDVERNCDITVLAAVPDMNAVSKGGYYTKSSKGKAAELDKTRGQVGASISFAASEAYKLLRTKIQFSFADENDCYVIGVSSAMAGEGKSTSSANLAYSLAQLSDRVLLMDCDLRRPSIPNKLNVDKMPGLTDFLTRQVSLAEAVQTCKVDDVTFSVIASGRTPPNPIELLSSMRMQNTMETLRKNFNYIILDLPPVSEVSDALVASKMADGMLMVVRQDYCNRYALKDTVRQFGFVEGRILGALVNCATEEGSGYGSYGKYGRKYYKYYHRYGGRYAAAAGSRGGESRK